jgi:hypothetical protein
VGVCLILVIRWVGHGLSLTLAQAERIKPQSPLK